MKVYELTDHIIKNKIVVQFAILCASSVIDIYTKKYPWDTIPTQAIKSAQKYLTTTIAADGDAAYAAADAAYYSYASCPDEATCAAGAAAAYAAYAAAYAARDEDAIFAASEAAAYASEAACAVNRTINFCKLADVAVKITMKGEVENGY